MVSAIDYQALQIANDPTLTPDEKRSQVAALYSTPAMQAPPTMIDSGAVASNAPASSAPTFAQRLNPFVRGAPPPEAPAAPPVDLSKSVAQAATYQPVAPTPAPQEGHPASMSPEEYAAFQKSGQSFEDYKASQTAAQPPAALGTSQIATGDQQGSGAAPPPQLQVSRPSFATVGTDTFQPVARTVKQGFHPSETLEDMRQAQGLDEPIIMGLDGKPTTGPQSVMDTADLQEAQAYALGATQRAQLAAAPKITAANQAFQNSEDERQRQLSGMMDQARKLQDDISSTHLQNRQEAEDTYWANKGTLGRIAMIVAAGLSGLATGLAGKPEINPILNKVNSEIDQDMASQRAQLKSKLAGLDAQNTLIGQAQRIFSDQRAADAFAKDTAIQQVNQDLQRFADVAQNPARKAQVQLVQDQLAQEQIKQRIEWEKSLQGTEVDQERFDKKHVVQTGGGISDPWADAFAYAKKKKGMNDTQAEAYANKYFPNGGIHTGKSQTDALTVPGYGLARSEKEAQQLRQTIASSSEFQKTMAQLQAINQRRLAGLPLTSDANDADALTTKARAQYSQLLAEKGGKGGKPSDKEIEQANRQIPDATSWRSGRNKAFYDAATSDAAGIVDERARQVVIGGAPQMQTPGSFRAK